MKAKSTTQLMNLKITNPLGFQAARKDWILGQGFEIQISPNLLSQADPQVMLG